MRELFDEFADIVPGGVDIHLSDGLSKLVVDLSNAPRKLSVGQDERMMMAAPQLRLTTADHVEAIGMRLLRISEDMRNPSRHHGRSDRSIDEAEEAALDLRATVRA